MALWSQGGAAPLHPLPEASRPWTVVCFWGGERGGMARQCRGRACEAPSLSAPN